MALGRVGTSLFGISIFLIGGHVLHCSLSSSQTHNNLVFPFQINTLPSICAVRDYGYVTEVFRQPSRFEPPAPTDSPDSLFYNFHCEGVTGPRFVRRTNHNQILIYTDGACLRNGQEDAAAGWAFVFRVSVTGALGQAVDGTCSGRLELEGPTGVVTAQTSNRAELRAVIAALQFRAWHGEGWTQVVIATDSEYVVNGATNWIHRWMSNGWLTAHNTPVLNRDLWELLFEEAHRNGVRGTGILFWHIPRNLNGLADRKAKDAAAEEDIKKFCKILGVMV